MSFRPRHALTAGLLLAGLGCAHIQPPSGGPVDRTPPHLVVTRPDSMAVVPNWDGPVVFKFTEGLSEQRVVESVLVSPQTSPLRVDKSGDEIRVSLRHGWQPGVVYHITVLPEVQDLFGNKIPETLHLVFSTGPAIPATRLAGTVVDRITQKPDTAVRVEAIHQPDSLVYATRVDSAGGFTLAHVPEGAYLVRAYHDVNQDRELQSYEARDTTRVSVATDTSAVGLLHFSIVAPDSTAPRLASAQITGPRTLELKFDDYLDPTHDVGPAQVRVLGPDSAALPVARVAFDAVPDTIPSDTVAADTAAADSAATMPPADTVATAAPLPTQTLGVLLAPGTAFVPGARYAIVVSGVTNIVGLSGDARIETTAPAANEGNSPAAGTGGQ
ncbi:MAG TPA: carboxypeptidase-like regulatory domain-containing protein [Longimicrobiaceae bacterium]|nr:carboxypeptidase-like regulatory domain-containing protein [Longimicrobiaceae bacterium]